MTMTGQTVSHYRILEKLGEGGMGVVWKAEDLLLKRVVALKFLHGSDDLPRLLREAQVAASLNHPNISTVYEVDAANGFLAMEFVEGESLAAKIGGRPLPVEEAVRLGVQICEALKAAHAKGIIHRDIKSGNILITEHGQATILDFGLARVAGQAGLTREGGAAGTPGYMAPEQMRGEAVDRRTDIWAFGAVLHEMLTGRPPTGQTDTLPEGLGRAVRKSLAADPGERYQHIEDLLVDLRRWQAPSLRRSRRWVIAAAAATATAAGAAGVWVWRGQSQRPAPLTSLVVPPFENTSNNPDMEYLSDGVTESLINSLSHVRQLQVMARATAFRFKGRQSEPQAIGRELKVRAVLTGRLLQVGDGLVVQADLVDTDRGIQLWGRRYDRKLGDILAIQDDVAREIADNLRLELTHAERANLLKRYTENTEAYQIYLRGRSYWNRRIGDSLEMAEGYFTRAIRLDPEYALAYSGLADCYGVGIEYLQTRPKDVIPRALAAARKSVQLDDLLAEGHTSLAWVLTIQRDHAEAVREFQRAIELNPHYPMAHHWYSLCLFRMGRIADAMREMERAGELDPLSFQVPAWRGRLLHEEGRDEESIEALRDAQQLNPQYPFYSLRLSEVYLDQGRYPEALEALQQYLKVDPTRRHHLLGRLYGRWGRREEARQMLQGALNRWRETYYPPSWIAEVYLAMGDRDRALEWLERACAEHDYFFIPVERHWNAIRSDPRFEVAQRRINTPWTEP